VSLWFLIFWEMPLRSIAGACPNSVPSAASDDAKLMVVCVVIRRLWVKTQCVLYPEILHDFSDCLRELFVRPGEERLSAGVARELLQHVFRVIDEAAVIQRYLFGKPAE